MVASGMQGYEIELCSLTIFGASPLHHRQAAGAVAQGLSSFNWHPVRTLKRAWPR
jgi:hypothetical protein